jgi:hypothetical protein
MSDENSNPLKDVRDGVGLLFRAAKWAVNRLPTESVEDVVKASAREVSRAVKNVASTIEREVLRGKTPPEPEGGKRPEPSESPSTEGTPTKPRI